MDKLWCDVVSMTACSLLLGRPWQWDRSVIHHGKDNICSVLMDEKRIGLKPLPPKHVPMTSKDNLGDVLPTFLDASPKGAHTCLSSCRNEVLEGPTTKREMRNSLLHIRHAASLDVGDYVWLSLAPQKLHINHKHDEPMDEGPFEVVHKLGYETYKVQLGNGICDTLGAKDLVSFFDKT